LKVINGICFLQFIFKTNSLLKKFPKNYFRNGQKHSVLKLILNCGYKFLNNQPHNVLELPLSYMIFFKIQNYYTSLNISALTKDYINH